MPARPLPPPDLTGMPCHLIGPVGERPFQDHAALRLALDAITLLRPVVQARSLELLACCRDPQSARLDDEVRASDALARTWDWLVVEDLSLDELPVVSEAPGPPERVADLGSPEVRSRLGALLDQRPGDPRHRTGWRELQVRATAARLSPAGRGSSVIYAVDGGRVEVPVVSEAGGRWLRGPHPGMGEHPPLELNFRYDGETLEGEFRAWWAPWSLWADPAGVAWASALERLRDQGWTPWLL